MKVTLYLEWWKLLATRPKRKVHPQPSWGNARIAQRTCVHTTFDDQVPCGRAVPNDSPNGWLCTYHDAMVIPTQTNRKATNAEFTAAADRALSKRVDLMKRLATT